MNNQHRIIGHQALRSRLTGVAITPEVPVYAEDWPYKEIAPNQIIMRYMDFWKFDDLFTTQELYFSRADKFPDLLEGTISLPEVHGTSASDIALKQIIVDTRPYSDIAAQRDAARATTFISCWNINSKQDEQMWSAYTKSPDSVVIITTAARLHRSLCKSKLGRNVFKSPVKYIEATTPRTEFDERSLFFYKDISFKFEQEYRLLLDMISLKEPVAIDEPKDFGRRVPICLACLISAIDLHPAASKKTEDELAKLVRKHLPNAIEHQRNASSNYKVD